MSVERSQDLGQWYNLSADKVIFELSQTEVKAMKRSKQTGLKSSRSFTMKPLTRAKGASSASAAQLSGAQGKEISATDRLDWRVAIIGYDSIRLAKYLDAHARQSGKPELSMDDGRRKTHFVQYIDDAGLRRSFYQALLEIEWLPSEIQSAIMSELGPSLQKRKSDVEKARTITLKHLVDECKARMREKGEQRRGGVHNATVTEIAARHGMKAEALKQRVTRLNKRSRQ